MKNKIGIVTYYKSNYGSILQCYATKEFLESEGYKAVIIGDVKKSKLQKVESAIIRIMYRSWKCIRYPGYFSEWLRINQIKKQSEEKLSAKTVNLLNEFIRENISPSNYSWKDLESLGKSSEFLTFFAGSDQIWNPSSPVEPKYFLKFVPNEKRNSLAASFGVSKLPEHILHEYKRELSKFSNISVREIDGIKILSDLRIDTGVLLPDPTVLLTKSKWLDLASSSSLLVDGDYLLIHLLGKPQGKSYEILKRELKKWTKKIIVFGNYWSEICEIRNTIYIEGGPNDYLSLINGADQIYTDSFHTTLFSIYYNKNFITLERNYGGMPSQQSRVINLLSHYHLLNRLISDENNINSEISPINYSSITVNNIIDRDREILIKYINDIVKRSLKSC